MSRFFKFVGVTVLAAGVAACNASSPASPSPAAGPAGLDAGKPADPGKSAAAAGAKPGTMTIVEIVQQPDDEFDVLQAAVVKAGLVDALNGRTQYTVFAPTDAAFVSTLGVASEAAAIDAVNNLDVKDLTNILLFHVTEGRRISTSVLAAPQYTMLNGGTLTRDALSAAGIAKTDISASNGVIHVINAVLLP